MLNNHTANQAPPDAYVAKHLKMGVQVWHAEIPGLLDTIVGVQARHAQGHPGPMIELLLGLTTAMFRRLPKEEQLAVLQGLGFAVEEPKGVIIGVPR